MQVIKSFLDVYLQNPELLIITIILFLLSIILKIYYKKFRGYMGEFWVKRSLSSLPRKDYIVLNDIMIEDECGTHQIDHIVISSYGIFVIEVKNYYGLIRGSEFDDKWYQYLGKRKYPFYNPIHQNYGHLECLVKLLNIDRSFFIPIICFSNQVKLKVKSRNIVTQLDLLNREILKFSEKKGDLDIVNLKNLILSRNIIDKKQRKNHVSRINEKKERMQSLENNMICPKCHGKLVEKNGKYGKFIGCSNYPTCRYIKK